MRTEERFTQGRLSPEEIEAVRARFIDFEGRLPDVRAHGAVTIGDVADAFGVAPEEVQRVLDRYREERALTKPGARRMDQKGLFALAVILFGTAFGIYKYGPRKLSLEEQEAQMDARMKEIMARRKKNPPIHYPILTKIKTGALPPFGFSVTLKGRLTETTTTSASDVPMSTQAATEALTEALMNAYETARKAELAAPEPKKPLPKKDDMNWGFAELPGTFRVHIGTPQSPAVGYVNLDPSAPDMAQNGMPTGVRPTREYFANLAKGCIDSCSQTQEASLKPQSVTAQYLSLPAGYRINFKGKSTINIAGNSLNVLPFDSKRVAARLETAVRSLILQDNKAPIGRLVGTVMTTPTKNPIPAFLEATITGPLGEVRLKIP
ncbi:hypothetical protein EON82_11745, partial [bacterium]